MIRQYKYLSIILAGGLLTACSSEEPTSSGEGMNSAQITAGINTSATRANGAEWEADYIGVTVIDAPNSNMEDLYKNVRYKTDALGGSAVFTPDGNEGIFFQDASETVTFSAYGPYRDWTIAPDAEGFNTVDMADSQMGREAQKSVDFIHASGATASNASPTVTFTGDNAFRHVMSRLVIVVKIAGSGDFSDNALTEGSYSLGGMKLQALFNPYTGEAKASDAPAVNDWYLNSLPSNTGEGSVSYTAILPPQTLESALTFTAKVDGQTFANSSLIKPALESGKSYRYTITVSKTGMTVSGCTITDWTIGDDLSGDATMPQPPTPARKGDFFYSDGTYSSTLDASKTCIGIVFWTPADANPDPNAKTPASLSDDKVKNADFPECNHGLVVALKDAGECVWQNTGKYAPPSVYEYFQKTSNFAPANKSDYYPIAFITTNGFNKIDYITGYQNTKILKAYNAWCINSTDPITSPVTKAHAIDLLDEFASANKAPVNTTGWYIPSPKELWVMVSKDVDNIWEKRSDSSKYFIDNLIKEAGGEGLKQYIWSSLELHPAGGSVANIALEFPDCFTGLGKEGKTASVRPVLAF